MRQSDSKQSTKEVDISNNPLREKAAKVNNELTSFYDFSEIELQIKCITYNLISDEFIDGLVKFERAKIVTFLREFETLIKDVFNLDNDSNIDYCNSYNLFFAKCTKNDCKTVIEYLKDALIHSELANDFVIRSSGYLFLVNLEKFIFSINKIHIKNKAIA
jgi:hypothetical protein